MRIGELAKLTGTSIKTIRYYVNIGLLVPRDINNQHYFDESDLSDLNFILKLKGYRFSLKDIHRMLSLKRISNLQDHGDIEDYIDFYVSQKNRLISERSELNEIISDIIHEITQLSISLENMPTRTGVPISMLDRLYCPHCHKPLKLKDASIAGRYVLSGRFFCNCGYVATVEDGILCVRSGRGKEVGISDINREHIKKLTSSEVSLLHRAQRWVIDEMSDFLTNDDVVLESHLNSYSFVYGDVLSLNPSCKYILTDTHFDILKMFKDRIDRLNSNNDILYIYDPQFDLPLNEGSVTTFIDFLSSNNVNCYNSDYLSDEIEPLLKDGARVIGAYQSYESPSRSLKIASGMFPDMLDNNYDWPKFSRHFLDSPKYELLKEKSIGSTVDCESNSFRPFHADGDRLMYDTFLMQKKKV